MFKYLLAIMISPLLLAGSCAPTDPDSDGLVGDVDRGRVLFENGDGASPKCITCHCADASGGCRLNAPDIRGEGVDDTDRRTRSPDIPHSGGKFQFTDQDIADLAAYLQSLGG